MVDAEYDYIFRVNRCQSLGFSGTRIDGLYATLGGPFFTHFLTPQVYNTWIQAKQFFVNNRQYPILQQRWPECCTKEQFENCKILTFPIEGFKRIIPDYNPEKTPTSTFKLLDYLLYTSEWRDIYDITITGCDIEGRDTMMQNGFNWRYTSHKDVGKQEADYIIREHKQGNLKILDLK